MFTKKNRTKNRTFTNNSKTLKKYSRKMRRKYIYKKCGGDMNNRKINETKIELIMNPNTSKKYTREQKDDNKEYETGDFTVNVYNKDANMLKYLKKKLNSVDSFLANILNECSDWTCMTKKKLPLISKQTIVYKDDKDTYARKN
jgi:hypothetical protein